MALPAPRPRWRSQFAVLLAAVALAAMALGGQVAALQPVRQTSAALLPVDLAARLAEASDQVALLDRQQKLSGHHLQNPAAYTLRLVAVRDQAESGQAAAARQILDGIMADLNSWQVKLDLLPGPAASNTPLPAAFVPIVMYHDPPANLEEQLAYLQNHGYTSVNMDAVAAALAGGPALPAKPVVITFDDGFESQWAALPLLERYHMKATFYIIDGGAGSAWHIGANRRVPDPQGGPAYLSWDQIRQIDRNRLFTIGSHTVNHLELAKQPEAVQRFEIIEGKRQLEQQLDHPVRAFAYPYGSFNATTVEIVKEAGFSSAVTTEAGADQIPGDQLVLHRIRSTLTLP